MERKYFEINETSARQAHNMMSFSDYDAGSATKSYRSMVDEVYNLADRVASEKPERANDAYYLAERYSKKLAENINNDSNIGCRCPSVMIAGPANFPVRKKEKQVAAWERNAEERKKIEEIRERIKKILYGKELILSNDEKAIDKLHDKLEGLKKSQELMKSVNAYYRKNKTLDGCPDLTHEQIEKLKNSMSSQWHYEDKPYPTWALTNNNATIRNTEKRLEELKKVKAQETTETETDFFKVVRNTEAMRLQLFFDGKPDPEVRDTLKSNGFRWAPSNSCWQRQLTPSAEYALKKVINAMQTA